MIELETAWEKFRVHLRIAEFISFLWKESKMQYLKKNIYIYL